MITTLSLFQKTETIILLFKSSILLHPFRSELVDRPHKLPPTCLHTQNICKTTACFLPKTFHLHCQKVYTNNPCHKQLQSGQSLKERHTEGRGGGGERCTHTEKEHTHTKKEGERDTEERCTHKEKDRERKREWKKKWERDAHAHRERDRQERERERELQDAKRS